MESVEHHAIFEMFYSSVYKYDWLNQALKIKTKAGHKLQTNRIKTTDICLAQVVLANRFWTKTQGFLAQSTVSICGDGGR